MFNYRYTSCFCLNCLLCFIYVFQKLLTENTANENFQKLISSVKCIFYILKIVLQESHKTKMLCILNVYVSHVS